MRPDRALLVSLGVLILAVSAFVLRQNGPDGVPWLPSCLFHKLTGLHCPGCGMTRAAHAMFHGDIAGAFRFNPVGMVLLPVALVGVGLEVIGWARVKPFPYRLRTSPRVAWSIAILVIAFTIFRNLPWWPFTLLAPP